MLIREKYLSGIRDFYDETSLIKIIYGLRRGGYFVGNFFGINDEWNTKNDRRTFFSKEEVIQLFSDFEILEMQEIEKDKPTAEGKMKHWHTIEIIAKKHN